MYLFYTSIISLWPSSLSSLSSSSFSQSRGPCPYRRPLPPHHLPRPLPLHIRLFPPRFLPIPSESQPSGRSDWEDLLQILIFMRWNSFLFILNDILTSTWTSLRLIISVSFSKLCLHNEPVACRSFVPFLEKLQFLVLCSWDIVSGYMLSVVCNMKLRRIRWSQDRDTKVY